MSFRFALSCEHAHWEVPDSHQNLGLTEDILRSHVSWDPGALPVAERLSERLSLPLHRGRWSRLLTDLNRDPEGQEVVPSTAFGVEVPGNQGLSPDDIQQRIARFHQPYWQGVQGELIGKLNAGPVVHLSIHSFSPDYGQEERPMSFGILHDPSIPFEANIAGQLLTNIQNQGFSAEPNRPYLGTTDYLVTSCRKRFAATSYAGILVEINQKHLHEFQNALHSSTYHGKSNKLHNC